MVCVTFSRIWCQLYSVSAGLFPADSFIVTEMYGLPLPVTADEKLNAYLDEVGI